jgi:hypothetical protein
MERYGTRSIHRLDFRQPGCWRCHTRSGRGAQSALEPLWDGKARRGVRVIYFHLTAEEIVLLVMVYAKAAQANVKPKDIKRGAKP